MEHYYSETQKSLLNIRKIKQKIMNKEFDFYTASGVFSKDKIDKGTLVLAENMIVDKNSKVLDIGCGIGILGIVAAKISDSDVVMSDVNERAVTLAKKNIKLNDVKAEVYQGNLYQKINQKDFDAILSNPPQTAGKELCFRLIEEAKEHLKNNGSLQLVARHNKGGKTLSRKMEEVFGNIKVIAKKAGYWVYFSTKNE
ncbi:class I SAM-dependent methyltransferase [Candidatus Woesearchaeota archaeon]|nr:class I SAM-dependent methyltransferase [Candidatus Woesearchaeota archaeon]